MYQLISTETSVERPFSLWTRQSTQDNVFPIYPSLPYTFFMSPQSVVAVITFPADKFYAPKLLSTTS